MEYRLTPDAEQDLRGIWSYTFENYGRLKANNYLAQMEARFLQLCELPELGIARNEIRDNYRSLLQKQHVIFYRQHNEAIEIVRVLHARMDFLSAL